MKSLTLHVDEPITGRACIRGGGGGGSLYPEYFFRLPVDGRITGGGLLAGGGAHNRDFTIFEECFQLSLLLRPTRNP